jgi:hypothetical protein
VRTTVFMGSVGFVDGVDSVDFVDCLGRVFHGCVGMVVVGSVDRFGGPCGGLLGTVSRCCSTGKRGGLRGYFARHTGPFEMFREAKSPAGRE